MSAFCRLVIVLCLCLAPIVAAAVEWEELPNTRLVDLPGLLGTGAGGCPFGVGPNGIIGAWNSGAFDTRERRFVIPRSGGHGDYCGNQVVAFDLPSLTWQMLKAPTPPELITPNLATNADGTPQSVHTYDGVVYLPDQHALYVAGGSQWWNGNPRREGWIFDLMTFEWTRMADSPLTSLGADMVWDPTSRGNGRGRALVFNFRVREYDPVSDTYVQLIGSQSDKEAQSAVLDVVGRMVYFLGGRSTAGCVRKYNLLTPTVSESCIVTSGANSIETLKAPGFIWIEAFARAYGYARTPDGLRGELRAFDPMTGVWSVVSVTGGPPPRPTQKGVWKRLFRDGCDLYVITSASENVWRLLGVAC